MTHAPTAPAAAVEAIAVADVGIRSAADRWQEVGRLAAQLHQIVHHNARIDATPRGVMDMAPYARLRLASRFEKELAQLRRDVGREIDRVTIDGLRADLKAKQKADAKAAGAVRSSE